MTTRNTEGSFFAFFVFKSNTEMQTQEVLCMETLNQIETWLTRVYEGDKQINLLVLYLSWNNMSSGFKICNTFNIYGIELKKKSKKTINIKWSTFFKSSMKGYRNWFITQKKAISQAWHLG